MGFIQEFKKFAIKGNMVDMAVGIIIGGAFGKIVSSLVSDVIMPPLGLLTAGVDFKDYHWVLKEAEGEQPKLVLEFGSFVDNVLQFLIVAFAVFLLVKAINSMRQEEEAPAPKAPPKQEVLLEEIRDLLKKE